MAVVVVEVMMLVVVVVVGKLWQKKEKRGNQWRLQWRQK